MGGLLQLATCMITLQGNARGLGLAIVLFALISAGIAVYGLLLQLFGVTGWREAISAVRRPASRDLRT